MATSTVYLLYITMVACFCEHVSVLSNQCLTVQIHWALNITSLSPVMSHISKLYHCWAVWYLLLQLFERDLQHFHSGWAGASPGGHTWHTSWSRHLDDTFSKCLNHIHWTGISTKLDFVATMGSFPLFSIVCNSTDCFVFPLWAGVCLLRCHYSASCRGMTIDTSRAKQ